MRRPSAPVNRMKGYVYAVEGVWCGPDGWMVLCSVQWKTCWVFSECELFLVSLRFAYGMALIKKGNRTVRSRAH